MWRRKSIDRRGIIAGDRMSLKFQATLGHQDEVQFSTHIINTKQKKCNLVFSSDFFIKRVIIFKYNFYLQIIKMCEFKEFFSNKCLSSVYGYYLLLYLVQFRIVPKIICQIKRFMRVKYNLRIRNQSYLSLKPVSLVFERKKTNLQGYILLKFRSILVGKIYSRMYEKHSQRCV